MATGEEHESSASHRPWRGLRRGLVLAAPALSATVLLCVGANAQRAPYPLRIAFMEPLVRIPFDAIDHRAEHPAQARPPLAEPAPSEAPGDLAAADAAPDPLAAVIALPDKSAAPRVGAKAASEPARINALGVLALRYDLDGAVPATGAFEVRKAVALNGVGIGTARIRIEGETNILLDTAAIGLVQSSTGGDKLAERLAKAADGKPFVSLRQIRKAGVEVRYDAIRDRIELAGST